MLPEIEIFMETGPCITQAQAGRLLNVTRERIRQMIKERKLEKKKILSVEMITIRSIIKAFPTSQNRSDVATEK